MSTLAQFLRDRRGPLVERWLASVKRTLRSEEPLDDDELRDSLHFFIDELVSGMESGRGLPEAGNEIAQAHGAQRQVLRRDIADMVREYGLFFQCVVDECREQCVGPFDPAEYAQLVSALNGGASEAVREYAALRDLEQRRQAWEHFAFLAHDIRNSLASARLSAKLLRSNRERGLEVLERSLAQLGDRVDGALMEARLRGLDAGVPLHREPLELARLLADVVAESRDDAEVRRIRLVLEAPPQEIRADARVLRSAVTNLIRNAVKFTRSGGTVTVRASPRLIEVEDECGGLKPGDEEKIFGTFRQAGEDRSGFGLGLAIATQAVQAHGGELSVRNLPGKGCAFSLRLPT